MKTFTGRYIDPLRLRDSDIDILDIAHHLSMICRFNGACRFHYSVAQHSIYVASIAKMDRLAALLHDASEAYLTDLPRPIKHTPEFEFYRKLEKEVQSMIFVKFGLSPDMPPEVKEADNAMVVAEGIQLMNELYTDFGPPAEITIAQLTPEEAGRYFLAEYQSILFSQSEVLKPKRLPNRTMH